jgi:farnesyl-diphosphate farnesyltransferase
LQLLAAEFGKALQLVNILRDLPADLRTGRSYLPAEAPAFSHWHARALELLASGRTYICSLRPARVRAGCFLPWELARQTLALLAEKPPLETPERVKISRAAVRGVMLRAIVAAFSNAPLR